MKDHEICEKVAKKLAKDIAEKVHRLREMQRDGCPATALLDTRFLDALTDAVEHLRKKVKDAIHTSKRLAVK